jgi:indole-3-glycerol phosphate synthase
MNFLEKILEVKQQEVSALKQNRTIKEYDEFSLFYKPTTSLIKTIRKNKNISIIAEIKKASPSKGVLIENFDHIDIAQKYFRNGVDAISIVTDEQYFQGSIEYLNEIAQFNRLKAKPLLRKDFIIDDLQIFQAKENGADAILLICEILTKQSIRKLTKTAQLLGMEVLLELHDPDQLDKIDFSLNNLIGVNNRNLDSFVTDLGTTEEVKKLLPDDIVLVSESGINGKDDIHRIKDAGCDAVLIGTYFIQSGSIEQSLSDMIAWCKD